MQLLPVTQIQADAIVCWLGLDNEVDDYEAREYSTGITHTYFLECPQALQISPSGDGRILDVENDTDTGRLQMEVHFGLVQATLDGVDKGYLNIRELGDA